MLGTNFLKWVVQTNIIDIMGTCSCINILNNILNNVLIESYRQILHMDWFICVKILIVCKLNTYVDQNSMCVYIYIRGVTRHLSHETRRDTRLSPRERDEMRFLDFFLKILNDEIYWET